MSMYVDKPVSRPDRKRYLIGGWSSPGPVVWTPSGQRIVERVEDESAPSMRQLALPAVRSIVPVVQLEAPPPLRPNESPPKPVGSGDGRRDDGSPHSVVAAHRPTPREPAAEEVRSDAEEANPPEEQAQEPARVAAPAKPSIQAKPPVCATSPAAVMHSTVVVPSLLEIQREGPPDEPLTDAMFEACRARITAEVLAVDFKVIGDSKFTTTYKDKDKSLAIRTFVQIQKPIGFPARDAFELRSSAEYEQSSDGNIKNFAVLQKAQGDPSGLSQTVTYQMYKMPPGIDNREFLTMKRKIVDENAGSYEMLSRSVTWPSKPAAPKPMRATVFAYTRVEPVPGKPHTHTCTTLTYSDLKGGLQQKMAGQMEKAMISRGDDGAKALIKELTKTNGKPKPV
jgi:hypothetical protein